MRSPPARAEDKRSIPETLFRVNTDRAERTSIFGLVGMVRGQRCSQGCTEIGMATTKSGQFVHLRAHRRNGAERAILMQTRHLQGFGWRSVWSFRGCCDFLRLHRHWCATGFCRCCTVTHADTAVVLESSWNPRNLSRFWRKMNPGRRVRPCSGCRRRRRVLCIGHTSARSARSIKVI